MRSMLALAALALVAGCDPGQPCDPGQVLVNYVCVAVPADAGAPDADAGSVSDPTASLGLSSVRATP